MIQRVLLIIATVALLFVMHRASGQEHAMGHPQKDLAIHEQFYINWMQPNNRAVSCCDLADCAPAEAYFKDGHWWARKDSEPDKDFTEVPTGRVETERDNPDGRNHLCGRRYHFTPSDGDKLTVFCFIAGGGT